MVMVISAGLLAFVVAGLGLVACGLPMAWIPWMSAAAPLLSAAVIALPVAGLTMAVSGHDFTSDLRYVGRSLEQMLRQDQVGPSPGVRTLDEVGRLTVAFDELRSHFQRTLAQERKARREAEVAEVYQTEFLRAISHELRTPLNALLGFTDILLSEIDGPLTESQREDLTIIRASGRHLLALFDDLLDLSAAASGRLSLRLETVDLSVVLRDVRDELLGQVRDKPVEVRLEIDRDLPPLRADPKRLRQLLGNVAGNALRMTAEGHVALRACVRDGFICVDVADTGPGLGDVPPAALFEEWGQAEGERRRTGGAGLGLAISRHLVELHGGRIRAHSDSGVGSTFVICLPFEGPT